MGNTLCKERVDRAGNSKSPVDRVIGRCAQVMPNRSKDKNTNWHKHVLETSPPLTDEPKCTNLGEWRNVTLRPVANSSSAAVVTGNGNSISPELAATARPQQQPPAIPVAPPRRKRSNATINTLRSGQPGGFKDVFGHLQRRASVDSAVSSAGVVAPVVAPKRYNSSANILNSSATDENDGRLEAAVDADATPRTRVELKRKVSKVGNKKSDKFFGENLSDCLSDEHINVAGAEGAAAAKVNQSDAIDAFVATNVTAAKHSEALVQGKVPDEAEEQLSGEDARSSLDRKAEFLMAMLENHSREEARYLNREPVEEPLIVPKRKHGRHICDDDERLAEKFSEHEQRSTEAEKIGAPAENNAGHHQHHHHHAASAEVIVSPKKPERDFSKYVSKNNESVHPVDDYSHLASEIVVERPARRKSSFSREKLPKPPPTPTTPTAVATAAENISTKSPVASVSGDAHGLPQRKHQHHNHNHHREYSEPNMSARADTNNQPIEPVHQYDSSRYSHDIVGSAILPPPALLNDEKLDSILKKCNSSQSFLTPDLMDQIVNKVYGFKMNWDDHDNVRNNGYDDGSAQVAPSSKLKTRKISVIRNKEPTEKPILEECAGEAAPKPSFSIGDTEVQVTHVATEKAADELPILVASSTKNEIANENTKTGNESSVDTETIEAKKTESIVEPKTDELEKVESAEKKIFPKVSAESENHPSGIKRTDTVIEFQQTAPAIKNPASENVLDNIYAKHQSILHHFQSHLGHSVVNEEITRPADTSLLKSNESDISLNQSPEPQIETTIVTPSLNATTTIKSADLPTSTPSNPFKDPNIAAVLASEERRGSIVDHDVWFNRHTDIEDEDHPIRREPQALLSFDTRKLFPFGRRERNYSESSEFFDDGQSLSSSTEQLNDDEMASKLRTMKQLDGASDHSTLLKYLEKEK